MGEINLERDELEAFNAIEEGGLHTLISQCLDEERVYPLRSLQLERCGAYVGSRLRAYERALSEYGKAKSTKKRSDTYQLALRAGSDLENAVYQGKRRAEGEEQERHLFFVDDHIIPPPDFTEHLSVSVHYRWRETAEDNWVNGTITFSHDVDLRPDYLTPKQKRKPSVAKQEQDRQEMLYGVWDNLMKSGLYSLKEFLGSGGKGAVIPCSFKAVPDSYSKGLNNYSTKFWRERGEGILTAARAID